MLHVHGKSSEEVKPFSDETWAQAVSCHNQRRQLYKNSKFFSINLPENYDDSMGYHLQCYRNFTAVPKSKKEQSSDVSEPRMTRSDVRFSGETSSGVFPRVCLFCDCISKSLGRNKGKEELGGCEVVDAADGIKAAARTLKDYKLQAKIADLDLIAKEVKYHHSCKNKYMKQAEREASRNVKEQSLRTKSHLTAFSELETHIQQNIVQTAGAESLKSLHERYKQHLEEEGSTYSAQSLQTKILSRFPSLKVSKLSNKQGAVIHHDKLSPDEAAGIAFCDVHKIKQAALYLRSLILQAMSSQKTLGDPLTAESLAK